MAGRSLIPDDGGATGEEGRDEDEHDDGYDGVVSSTAVAGSVPGGARDRYCAVTMGLGAFRGVLSGSVLRVGVGLVAVGGVVGCTAAEQEPAPTAAPTVTSEPTPDPEPTDEAPQEPQAPLPRTGTPDERDAEAAGEFFLELYEYVLLTGDTAQWEKRSDPECGFCANVLEAARENEAQGMRFEGVRIENDPARFVAFDDAFSIYLVEVPYRAAATQIVDGDGAVTRSFEPDTGFLRMEVGYEPRVGWHLVSGGSREESRL